MWPSNASGAWNEVRMPCQVDHVSRVRHALTGDLRAAGLPARVIADAELVLGELVTNSVLHGCPDDRGDIEVGWSLADDRLHVRVHDYGRDGSLVPLESDLSSDHGRGLAIVDQLCERWRVERDPGTSVVAELSVRD